MIRGSIAGYVPLFQRAVLLLLAILLLWGADRFAHAEQSNRSRADQAARPVMSVTHVKKDFEVTGDGSSSAWQTVPWTELTLRGSTPSSYKTRIKVVYSDTGLYVLMDASDRRLSATLKEDFADLWNEDVFEFFLWTDESESVYFEYEISPLGYELPILVPNYDGFFGWRPWHYEGPRRTSKAVTIRGGEQQPGAEIEGWRAEVFMPYELLTPLKNVPPQKGTRWRANFYRIDHDECKSDREGLHRGNVPATSWDWARVGPSFHEYQKFGTLEFQ